MDIISSICVEGEQPWLCTFGTHVSNVNNHGCSPLRQILLIFTMPTWKTPGIKGSLGGGGTEHKVFTRHFNN